MRMNEKGKIIMPDLTSEREQFLKQRSGRRETERTEGLLLARRMVVAMGAFDFVPDSETAIDEFIFAASGGDFERYAEQTEILKRTARLVGGTIVGGLRSGPGKEPVHHLGCIGRVAEHPLTLKVISFHNDDINDGHERTMIASLNLTNYAVRNHYSPLGVHDKPDIDYHRGAGTWRIFQSSVEPRPEQDAFNMSGDIIEGGQAIIDFVCRDGNNAYNQSLLGLYLSCVAARAR
jgi:hypothetical protein